MEGRTIAEQNSEMNEFLTQFPVEGRKIDETLADLETNVTAIRTHLENKPKKISMKQLDQKLDQILKILYQNGFAREEWQKI